MDSGWTDKNPVLGIKPPQVEPNPTLPFSQEEVQKILSACDRYEGDKGRMRAFILVMLKSGLRVSDTCTLRRDAVRNGKIFLRQAKTVNDEAAETPNTLAARHGSGVPHSGQKILSSAFFAGGNLGVHRGKGQESEDRQNLKTP